MSFHWPHPYKHATRLADPGLLDPEFDGDALSYVNARFATDSGLTAGQRHGYDASWFRVRGGPRSPGPPPLRQAYVK